MKLSINARLKLLFTFMSVCLFQAIAIAQDSTVQTTQTSKTSTETTFPGEPWMWIVGGIVLVLIIVALVRSNSSSTSSDKVTVTKTVERDTDV